MHIAALPLVDPGRGDLLRALRAAGVAEVATDVTHRAAYSTDASLYRVVPRAVVFPRAAGEVAAVVDVARAEGVPVTARGAGTSVAGNAVGPGIILDFSRYMNAVLDIDPEQRTARVQPGTVQAVLQAAAAPHGLRFGPDPSTHSRCTIGGMIGNNACGARTLSYGRTSDNVTGLDLVTGTGELLSLDASSRRGFDRGLTELEGLVRSHLAPVRTELGRFPRQISGYAVHELLPERGFDVTRFLVGSEGTLGIITEAEVRLVRDPAHRVLAVLAFPDMPAAADEIARVTAHSPSACEGLDARIVDVVRARRGPAAVPELPAGAAWLFVEMSGDDRGEALDRAAALVAEFDGSGRVVSDPAEAAALWRIREDGAGLAGTAPSGRPAWAGWEDAAVPPAALGAYLREFDALLDTHGLTAMPFGHFGDGCIHVRLDYPLGTSGPLREFLAEAARLVARHGGTLSGEHGDGRARSELLPHLYSAEVLDLFRAVKAVFDPDRLLNPGVLVDPVRFDEDLRLPAARPLTTGLAHAFDHDAGDLTAAVHRCTGVGRCRSEVRGPGTVMCPSYAATHREQDSTRGRARVLQEMANGGLVRGWRDPAVHEALDLCLSCKGCASDCPTGIDMARYKSEVLHQSYRGRLRPRSHYGLGRLPVWARLASRLPRLANRTMTLGPLRRLALWAADVDPRRAIPAFATTGLRQRARRHAAPVPGARPVIVFADSFSEHFAPAAGEAVLTVLRQAGYAPRLTGRGVCCGLTWISTGQLDQAADILRRTVAELVGPARAGVPIVGIEPSCTAVLRDDAVELLGTPDARAVAAATHTLAELLAATPGWEPPPMPDMQVVAQPHCHHHAVMGWKADEELLRRAGASVVRVGGCCGLAGNFGVQRGHYEVSVAVARDQLLPAVDAAPAGAVLLADGFSCRTQIQDLAGRAAVHLAELLVDAGGPRSAALTLGEGSDTVGR